MKSIDKIIKLAAVFQKKIAQDTSEANKILNWIINNSPIQFGKKDAREVLDFLNKKQSASTSNEEMPVGSVPDASKVDRVGAALVMYFYSVYGDDPRLHAHLIKNINDLLNAFGQYKNMINTTAEDLVTRWENAIRNIAKTPKGFEQKILSRYSYAPGLAEALSQVANKLKRR